MDLPLGLWPTGTTPLETHLASAEATWAMVPQSSGALLDLASLNKQPVEVAPSFYPEGELREAVKVGASSLLELLGDICHVVQRGLLLNSNRLSLPGSEVVEEAFPRPSPLCLRYGV